MRIIKIGRDCKRDEIEKTRDTRVRSYKELRETGEQKKRTFREREHLRLEEASELNN